MTIVVNQPGDDSMHAWFTDSDGHAVTIDMPETFVHYPGNGHHPCIHGPRQFPEAVLFSRRFVDNLNFQPVLFDAMRIPIIASRDGQQVTVAVNSFLLRGQTHSMIRCLNNNHKWTYRLHEMRWADEQNVSDQLWLGVRP